MSAINDGLENILEPSVGNPFKEVEAILKNHYGATHVLIDNDLITVYGSNVDAAYTAVFVEYCDEYDIVYEQRDEDRKKVVLKLEKKIQKVVDSKTSV